jgi:hypothetical protein
MNFWYASALDGAIPGSMTALLIRWLSAAAFSANLPRSITYSNLTLGQIEVRSSG